MPRGIPVGAAMRRLLRGITVGAMPPSPDPMSPIPAGSNYAAPTAGSGSPAQGELSAQLTEGAQSGNP